MLGVNAQAKAWAYPRSKFKTPARRLTPAGTRLGIHQKQFKDNPLAVPHLPERAWAYPRSKFKDNSNRNAIESRVARPF